MRLKLSLTRPTGGVRDVVVTADAVATVGDVATTLLARDPERKSGALPTESATLSVRFPGETAVTLLAAETPVTEARIASGADVAVIGASRPESTPGSACG